MGGSALLMTFFDAVNGRNAVVLFFVLSGFVLSESLQRSGLSPRACISFLVRRACRLLPLIYVMMAVSAVYLYLFLPREDLSRFGANWLLIGYFRPAPRELIDAITLQDYRINSVYWTLYVELIGSLLFIPIFWLTARVNCVGRLLFLVALMVVSFIGRDTLFPLYFFCFELGLLAHRLRSFADSRSPTSRKTHFIEPLAALVGVYMVAYAHSTIGNWVFQIAGGQLDAGVLVWIEVVIEGFGAAILIFGCSSGSRIVRAILGNRPLRILGTLSFSLYCIHFIVLKAIFPIWVALFGEALIDRPLLGPLLNIGFVVPVSLLLSAFMHSWVELPGIAAGRKISSALTDRFAGAQLAS